MGRWVFRFIVVVLLGITASAAWYFGNQFHRDLWAERNMAAVLPVPPEDLSELQGQEQATAEYLPMHIENKTIWHLTMVTLSLDTADDKPPLAVEVVQNFRSDPWAPGRVNTRDVFLPSEWSDRRVHIRVTAAEGFQ